MAKIGKITRDLTQAAREGQLDAPYGMDKKYFPVLQALIRTNRKNLLIVGEPDVGKVPFVYGLAVATAKGKPGDPLLEFSVLELDMPSLESRSKDVEDNVRSLITFLKGSKHILLFVQSIASILDEEADVLPSEIVKLLNPAIRKSEIGCIGTMTPSEYDIVAAQNPSMKQEFEKVDLKALTEDETLEILEQMRGRLQDHHSVKISDTALNAAVVLTQRFVPNRNLPGKAIEALDQAAARYKLKALAKENFPDMVAESTMRRLGQTVGPYDIMRTISEATSIDIEAAARESKTKLANHVRRRVIGQDDAIMRFSNSVVDLHMGCGRPRSPLSFLLFWGPPGVGKTLAARAMSEHLLEDASDYHELDMRQYADADAGKRLMSPGAEGGSIDFVDLLSKHPHTTLFMSGIENAHASVFDALLPMLKTGAIPGANDRPVDIKKSTLILSFNIAPGAEGRTPDKKQLKEALHRIMKPELLPLFDRVAEFKPLKIERVAALIDQAVQKLCNDPSSTPVQVQIDKAAYRHIAAAGYTVKRGARDLEQAVEKILFTPLKALVESGGLHSGDIAIAQMNGDELVVSKHSG